MIINPYSFGVPYDADAQAFLTAASITDPTISGAINTLVVQMKTDNIWSKMKAIYPMVGGTASTHKFNLKDPRDLDAAFRLVFNGGVTHSSNGVQGNGTNGYADTRLNPVTNGLTYVNNHLSFYSRSNSATSTAIYEMGCGNFLGTTNLNLWCRRNSNTAGYDSGNFNNNRNTFANTDGRGLFCGTVISTTSKYFKNGVQQSTRALNPSSIENVNMFLCGFNEGNSVTYYSDKQCAFSSIGDGLTDTEAANLYTAVQNFNTSLARQV